MTDAAPEELLYRQLAMRLADGIEQAGLAEGSRLPSVRTLATQHGVSLTTALQALRGFTRRLVKLRTEAAGVPRCA